MRIVLKFAADDQRVREQHVGQVALSFCNNLPADFKPHSRLKKVIDSFKQALLRGTKGSEATDVPDLQTAVTAAWSDLKGVTEPDGGWTSYFKDVPQFRAFLLLKAFSEGFRDIGRAMGATVPEEADQAWRAVVMACGEMEGTVMGKENRLLLEKASDVFSRVAPAAKEEPKPEEKSGPESKPSEPETKKPEEKKPEPESKPLDKKPSGDEELDAMEKMETTVDDLTKNWNTFKVKVKLPDKQKARIQRMMDALRNELTTTSKEASLMDAVGKLTQFIKPYLEEFIPLMKKEHSILPAEELVWRDPERLRAAIAELTPDEIRRALEQSEKIMGMITTAIQD